MFFGTLPSSVEIGLQSQRHHFQLGILEEAAVAFEPIIILVCNIRKILFNSATVSLVECHDSLKQQPNQAWGDTAPKSEMIAIYVYSIRQHTNIASILAHLVRQVIRGRGYDACRGQ